MGSQLHSLCFGIILLGCHVSQANNNQDPFAAKIYSAANTIIAGCPTGWRTTKAYKLAGTCYKFVTTPRTWQGARADCQSAQDGDLWEIDSRTEMIRIVQFLQWQMPVLRLAPPFWIGLSDIAGVGRPRWPSCPEVPSQGPLPSKVQLQNSGGQCAQMDNTFKFSLVDCWAKRLPYICKIKKKYLHKGQLNPKTILPTVKSPTYVDVTWEPDLQNCDVTKYRIDVKSTKADGNVVSTSTEVTGADSASGSVPGIPPYSHHEITVSAVLWSGTLPYAEPMFFSTLPDKPSCPPLVRLGKVLPTSLILSWVPLPASCANGPLKDYRIKYGEVSKMFPPPRVKLQTGTGVSITGLKPDTDYEVCVSGSTSEGFGPTKCVTARTPNLPPTLPVTLPATVTTKPAVVATKPIVPTFAVTVTASTTAGFIVVSSGVGGTTKKGSVTSQLVVSGATHPSAGTTIQPSLPTIVSGSLSVTVEKLGHTTLRVTWANVLPVTRYNVCYKPVPDVTYYCQEVRVSPGAKAAMSSVLEGLEAGTTYGVVVSNPDRSVNSTEVLETTLPRTAKSDNRTVVVSVVGAVLGAFLLASIIGSIFFILSSRNKEKRETKVKPTKPANENTRTPKRKAQKQEAVLRRRTDPTPKPHPPPNYVHAAGPPGTVGDGFELGYRTADGSFLSPFSGTPGSTRPSLASTQLPSPSPTASPPPVHDITPPSHAVTSRVRFSVPTTATPGYVGPLEELPVLNDAPFQPRQSLTSHTVEPRPEEVEGALPPRASLGDVSLRPRASLFATPEY